jgi:ABC-type nitrate/sulfonate/bicarbonate transport system substrate-binding protein
VAAALANKAPYYLMTRSSITTAGALNGHRVGISGFHDVLDRVLLRRLADHGVKPSETDQVELGGSIQKVMGIRSGQVAGAFVMADVAYREEDEQAGLLRPPLGFPDLLFTVIGYGERWARTPDNDLPVRVMRVLLTALEWLHDPANRTEAIMILRKRAELTGPHAVQAYNDLVVGGVFTRTGEISADLVKQMEALGSPIASFIDDSFRKRASPR